MAIGLNVSEPEGTCSDEDCPFHGTLSVRGQTLEGEVASTDMDKTVIVEREYDVPVPKYDRHMKRRSRVPAHHPDCMELEVGDTVRIAETRPLSKTKSHVVVEKFETTRSFAAGGTEHSDSSGEESTGVVPEGGDE
ncbi:30S ribosomal protein S17 [Halorussus sp. MSC15.2]|uniref:30S ribosomal protein S17 n=1 Tax=Halorussus sp. MSC15.2 TaxID=2283638 RepID=UPI0013D14A46|nr:30S ribosomal protein S17 [Halorussus sp. MSC15.2]NEU55926.1 30S ribosomal protein S17 [Halorussus sp. MSC15.2]